MIAALFVQDGGSYFGLDDVDPWPESRDARKYDGPHRVIAHPPCQRWGRYWSGGPMLARTPRALKKGDDAGCFASALDSVRKWGGVLEHPEASHAWPAFGLLAPPKIGGWIPAGDWRGFTCCVEQGHYGHPSRKATWLYAVSVPLPELVWGAASGKTRLDEGCHSNADRAARREAGQLPMKRISERERIATPLPFRDALLSIACGVAEVA